VYTFIVAAAAYTGVRGEKVRLVSGLFVFGLLVTPPITGVGVFGISTVSFTRALSVWPLSLALTQ
jgi:hypothetical protein